MRILLPAKSAAGPAMAGGWPVVPCPLDAPDVFQTLPFMPDAPAVER